MDGFISLVTETIASAGIDKQHIYFQKSLELPGYFRPTKEWDLLVVKDNQLIIALEAKSQVGPSFGNNFNNRTEEAMGSALDLWTAYREGAFNKTVKPWLGYLFMLVITGGGRAEKQVWKLLTARGLSQIVTIVPRLEMLRPVLAAGDIFIQPRPSDTFNPLLLEAMSVGAAVAGCKGGVDDLIIEDETAVVFDPADELSIYNTLRRLFDRRELAQQIAKAAQQYLRENYTVSNMISSTLQAYYDAQTWLKHRRRS